MNYSLLFTDKPDYVHDDEFDADWSVQRENSKKLITVRFEGTHSFKDVLVDLCAASSKVSAYDGANWTAHKGFKTAYYSVRDDVLNKCYKLYQEGDEFLICGHSLGGAMALLAAEDVAWHFKKKVLLITWGAPRVTKDDEGIEAIKSCIKDESVCFEDYGDLIPHLAWWYKRNPVVEMIGRKISKFKMLTNIMFSKRKIHCEHYGIYRLYDYAKLARC